MKSAGGRLFLTVALLAGCCGAPAAEPRWPSSLGAIPDDVPLPPAMPLDPGEDSWLRAGESGRSARICLEGGFRTRDLAEFFRVHMRLARWKPEDEEGGGRRPMVFRKGGEVVRIDLEDREGGGTRVRLVLNPGENMEGRDARS